MYKSCSRCGRIHDINHKCHAGQIYKSERTAAEKIRYTAAWQKKAAQIKEDSSYLCAVCKAEGIFNYSSLEVHHIEKLRDAPEQAFNDDNLICLCTAHHKAADRGAIKKDYLKKLAEGRRK